MKANMFTLFAILLLSQGKSITVTVSQKSHAIKLRLRFTDSVESFIRLFRLSTASLLFSFLNLKFTLGTFFHSLVCFNCWRMW